MTIWVFGYMRDERDASGVEPGARLESRAHVPGAFTQNPTETFMSDAPAENDIQAAEAAEAHSSYWPDDTVDMISALVVVTVLVAGVLWFVVNG